MSTWPSVLVFVRAAILTGAIGLPFRAAVEAAEPEGPPAPAGAVMVYIDPATGRPGVPPPGWEPEGAAAAARARGPRGPLVAEPSLEHPGGMSVDTEGLFDHALTTTVGPDGRVHVGCTDPTHPHATTGAK
jgi:hypothetical protein